MAKKFIKKSARPHPSESAAEPSDKAYPAEPAELEAQRQRLKKAAASGAEALKSPTPSTTPALQPTAPPAPPAPLTALAAVWPASAPAQGAPKSTQPVAQPTKIAVEWQPTQAPAKPAPLTAEVPKPPSGPKITVTFILPEPSAKRVTLTGDFNGWSLDATPMKRHEDGHWKTTLDLAPGRYQVQVHRRWAVDARPAGPRERLEPTRHAQLGARSPGLIVATDCGFHSRRRGACAAGGGLPHAPGLDCQTASGFRLLASRRGASAAGLRGFASRPQVPTGRCVRLCIRAHGAYTAKGCSAMARCADGSRFGRGVPHTAEQMVVCKVVERIFGCKPESVELSERILGLSEASSVKVRMGLHAIGFTLLNGVLVGVFPKKR